MAELLSNRRTGLDSNPGPEAASGPRICTTAWETSARSSEGAPHSLQPRVMWPLPIPSSSPPKLRLWNWSTPSLTQRALSGLLSPRPLRRCSSRKISFHSWSALCFPTVHKNILDFPPLSEYTFQGQKWLFFFWCCHRNKATWVRGCLTQDTSRSWEKLACVYLCYRTLWVNTFYFVTLQTLIIQSGFPEL